MLKGLFGPTSLSSMLRGGLEETSATHRGIAARVAGTLDASSSVDFPDPRAARTPEEKQADLERDMTLLADTQLRYESEARLLREAYDRLRTAMRERG